MNAKAYAQRVRPHLLDINIGYPTVGYNIGYPTGQVIQHLHSHLIDSVYCQCKCHFLNYILSLFHLVPAVLFSKIIK
jgi:hypothetical protein